GQLTAPTCSTCNLASRRIGHAFDALLSLRNNNKRRSAMLKLKLKHPKVRQAGLILFTTTLLLIVPNLNRLFG
ncbi:Uncharacterized protein ALO43_03628, partial [Pseudomonas tremae]